MSLEQQLRELGAVVDKELEDELIETMSAEDKVLHTIAQKLLLLERDLRVPGSKSSAEERATRLLDAIAKEDF